MVTEKKTDRAGPESAPKAFEQAEARFRGRMAKSKLRKEQFERAADEPIDPLYTPEHTRGLDYMHELGFPGEYPFTRGVYPTMYRGRLWTMRMFSGFGTARDTNKRYHYLLEKGQTGLSVAFDMATLMGYDSDHERAQGEVGREGVAICTLENMMTLFDGIDLSKVSTSMTINSPAIILLALYLAVAEKQGVAFDQVRGTVQNDILKEYQAQKEYIYPPRPSMRLIVDMIAYCTEHVPRWNTISISGYHIREAGSTAVQELAFTLANGFAYVEASCAAGLDVDAFAPRLSFFFNSHLNFFEEVAKFRAARRIWARRMRERYGARQPESCRLRFHTQTAGCSLTAQQPENNIVRTAYEALAAALGGTQSLHTNSFDEALALPTEHAVKLALRTQQIIANEIGVTDTIDPLAGSYYVEQLTNKMQQAAEAYFEKIDRLGGVIPAIEQGFFQREISRAAYQYQQQIDRQERIIVGVNEYVEAEGEKIDVLHIDPQVERSQLEELRAFKQNRDQEKTRRCLEEIKQAASTDRNLMPPILDAVRHHCTLGEIIEAMKQVFGTWREPPIYW